MFSSISTPLSGSHTPGPGFWVVFSRSELNFQRALTSAASQLFDLLVASVSSSVWTVSGAVVDGLGLSAQ